MKITIETIPHNQQRYETVGDWIFDDAGNLTIRVSDMGNWQREALVGFHELAEALVCKSRGITTEMVDAFDVAFAERGFPKEEWDGEPGDHPDCPCRKEHFFATTVERMLCVELGEDWAAYDAAVEAL